MYYFSCPSCRKRDTFYTIQSESADSGLGCLLFFTGGLFASLIYSLRCKPNTQCGACGFVFRRPPIPAGPVAKLLTYTVFLLILSACIGAFMETREYLELDIPYVAEFDVAAQFVARHSEGVAAAMSTFLALGGLAGTIILCVSIPRYRRDMAKRLQLHPQNGPRFEHAASGRLETLDAPEREEEETSDDGARR